MALPKYESKLTAELEHVQALISQATYKGLMSVQVAGGMYERTRKTLTEKGYRVTDLPSLWTHPRIEISW